MDSKKLRERLNGKLPTDAELSAFMIDKFPGVAKNLADGMNRLQKVNLLFVAQDVSVISTALDHYLTKLVIYRGALFFWLLAMGGLATGLFLSSWPNQPAPAGPPDLASIPLPPSPPDLRTDNQDFETITVEGEDPCGRTATFRMRIEVSGSTWVFGQTDAVEFGNKAEAYPAALLWIAEMIPEEHANRVICVGTASEEGNNDREGVRSTWRAKQLQRWLEQIWRSQRKSSPHPPLTAARDQRSQRPRYTLALGRYQPPDARKNSKMGHFSAENARKLQRAVMFVEILTRKENVNLEAALRDGMRKAYKRQELNYNVDHYSAFKLEPNEGASELDCPPIE